MPAITAAAFNGTLNTNEIYNTLYNIRILFQKLAPQTVHRDEIVSLVDKATGMYGDSGIIQGMDIQGTYDFGMDAEASSLLAINRNKSQKVERYVIDNWRQTDVTNDVYISKRAFLDEGAFAHFNGYLVSTLSKAMDAYESGMVKSSLGTYKSLVTACNISVSIPEQDDEEATERRRAALIKKAILDLKINMKDNQRGFNGYGHYASYDWNDFTVVWNSRFINEINALALYKAFNPEYLRSATDGRVWSSKWFGDVKTTTGTTGSTNTTIYSLIEINSDGSDNFPINSSNDPGTYRIFPGDLLPNSFAYAANTAYEVDDTVICKIFAPEYVLYMTGYQQGESFYNPRSATTNHYYRKGFSKVQVSNFRPFITITADEIASGETGD